MAIRSKKGLLDHMQQHSSACRIEIRKADDRDAAVEGLKLAGRLIMKIPHPEEPSEPAPNYVSTVNLTPAGPVIGFDMKDLRELMPQVVEYVRKGLREAGVRDAVIAWPDDQGPLHRLHTTPRAVLLRLNPPSRLKYRWRSFVPRVWLDEARTWITDAWVGHNRLWASVELNQFPLPIDDAGTFLAEQHINRAAQYALLVGGDPDRRIRLACGCFWGGPPVHYVTLAGGGPAADDEELALIFERLRWIARRLAGYVGSAHIDVAPSFAGWGGDPNSRVRPHADEFLEEAFHYQVLGPGHLKRLGGTPGGARALPGGRIELSVGELVSWLPGNAQREDSHQAARELLAPCLLGDDDRHELAQRTIAGRLLPPLKTQLLLRRDSPAGKQRYLTDRAVADGTTLELAIAGGTWIAVRYESQDGGPPVLRLALGSGNDGTRLGGSSARLVPPYWAVLRWPGEEVDPLETPEGYRFFRPISPEHPDDAGDDPWPGEYNHESSAARLDPETNLVLDETDEPVRHWLAGRPVCPGAQLELLADRGQWLPVSYEWPADPKTTPTFYLPLGGPWEAQAGPPATGRLYLPPAAVLRWPAQR